MKQAKAILIMLAIATIAICSADNVQAMDKKMQTGISRSVAGMDLQLAMRKLWEEHIIYTRNYIISALADLKDVDAVAQRLLRNQDDIGNAIKPFYGEAAGNKLARLLREHIMIATEVVKAAKEGNNKVSLDMESKRWTVNADAIAVFLSDANPVWSKQDLMDMLHKHLDLTTGEVVSRLKMDWPADINNYDMGHAHMLMFADALSNGIMKQFPEKFK